MARRQRLGAVPATPKRVVPYIRVSALMGRVEGSDDFHSPTVQLTAIERHVIPFGMQVMDAVQDIDVSGQTFSREGVDRIRAMAAAGEVDAVGLYDLKRFGRNVMESLKFIAELREYGVTILSTKEQIDDSPTGQFLLTQFLALAQLEGDQIGQRWAEIIQSRAEGGVQHGPAAMGYRKVNKRLEVDPVLGPAITRAFERYAQGWSISEITQALTRDRGKRVDRRILKAMFANPVYVGKVTLHGQVVRDGLHDALVDDDTWKLVQERLERDRGTPPRTLAVSHELVGLLVCGVCGRSLKRNDERQKTGRKVRRVNCSYSFKLYGDSRCAGVGNPALDPIVEETLRQAGLYVQRLRSSHSELVAVEARRAQAGSDVKLLERELEKTRAALGKLASAWAREQLTDEEHAEAARELRAAEQDLKARLGQVRVTAVAPPAAAVESAVDALRELWPEATIAERNMMLKRIVRQVSVRRGASRAEPVGARVTVNFR